MPKVDSLQGLFVEELRDLLDAEKQVLKALPKMAKWSSSPELSEGFSQHRDETKEQMDRLVGIFEELGEKPRAKKCKGVEALIEEGREMIEEVEEGPVRDALLIAAAQKIEHYEISSYGTLRTYANLLGQDGAAEWLENTLEEEKATDDKLTEIASTINPEAAEEGERGQRQPQVRGRGQGRQMRGGGKVMAKAADRPRASKSRARKPAGGRGGSKGRSR